MAREFAQVYSDLKTRSAAQSPDIRSAEALARQRQGQNYTAWTRWMPSVTFQASQARSKDYSFATSGALGNLFGPGFQPREVDLMRWSFNLSFPLYNRSVQLGIRQASLEKDIAEEQLGARRTELDWRLRAALGNYLLAAYRVAAAESALETARKSLKEVRARFELGEKTRIDVLKAESNAAALEAQLMTNRQQLVVERNSLLLYSGLTEADLREIGLQEFVLGEENINRAVADFTAGTNAGLAALRPHLTADPESLAARVTASNPSYRTVVSQEQLGRAQAATLMAGQWPDLSLQGSLNKQGPQWDEAFSPGERSYSVAIALSVPLFGGGSLFSNWRASTSAAEVAAIKRSRDTRGLVDEAENQRVQILALEKALAANEVRVVQNEEIVKLSQKSYQLGKTTTLELLSSQNDLLSSKVELVNTKIRLAVLTRQFAWNLGVEVE